MTNGGFEICLKTISSKHFGFGDKKHIFGMFPTEKYKIPNT